MPHFCSICGADEYICQKCGRVFCSGENPGQWRPDITENTHAGMVCGACIIMHGREIKFKIVDNDG